MANVKTYTMTLDAQELRDVIEAALGIDRRTLLADRRFPARHIGNKYTVSLTELARWMVQR